MSAYVVDHTVINRIVSTAIALNVWLPATATAATEPVTATNATRLGRRLLQECIRSVEYRYPQLTADDRAAYAASLAEYTFMIDPPATLGSAAKYLGELDYQSCEHPGWDSSDAHHAVRTIGWRVLLDAAYADAPNGLALRIKQR
jgi:hypothetical protein